eukprot:m.382119 g.382119  ORF g.382119 m.382119 type:complete len:86 (-) comp56246_c1_seq2:33-290(-)
MSMFTLNIYMNEEFSRGHTRFYDRLSKRHKREGTSGEILSVKPQTGLACVFRQPPGQSYAHDGDEVVDGVKYLFRSDVMFVRRAK